MNFIGKIIKFNKNKLQQQGLTQREEQAKQFVMNRLTQQQMSIRDIEDCLKIENEIIKRYFQKEVK